MQGTYQRITDAISKKMFSTNAIDLPGQFSAVFFYCQKYWTLLCRYNQLKKVQDNLPKELFDALICDSNKWTVVDGLCIWELWKHYKTINPDATSKDGNTVGAYPFFNNYLNKNWDNTKQELKIYGISDKTIKKLDTTIGNIFEPLYLNKINYEEKYQYCLLLKETLEMPQKSVEESVDEVLTKEAELRILELLKQNDEVGDITLSFLLADILSMLTDGNIRNSISKDYGNDFAIFTEKCTSRFVLLFDSVNKILKKYTLKKDQEQIKKMEKNVILFKNAKYAEARKTHQALYNVLVPCCLKWINKYQERWSAAIKKEAYTELKKKLVNRT